MSLSRRGRPGPENATAFNDRSRRLEDIIQQRISTRLGRRIRNLAVEVDRGVIRLAGQCSTYYSKQLAQHAVLGVVEDERIENRIEIAVPQAS
ncbi:BON domain-containing protein [Botrimarina sp.]|uniref:BON domain-containing protein n=1 Tax=Botrimarina sp. TaxID=2795802 RepID=UPI0032F04D70